MKRLVCLLFAISLLIATTILASVAYLNPVTSNVGGLLSEEDFQLLCEELLPGVPDVYQVAYNGEAYLVVGDVWQFTAVPFPKGWGFMIRENPARYNISKSST